MSPRPNTIANSNATEKEKEKILSAFSAEVTIGARNFDISKPLTVTLALKVNRDAINSLPFALRIEIYKGLTSVLPEEERQGAIDSFSNQQFVPALSNFRITVNPVRYATSGEWGASIQSTFGTPQLTLVTIDVNNVKLQPLLTFSRGVGGTVAASVIVEGSVVFKTPEGKPGKLNFAQETLSPNTGASLSFAFRAFAHLIESLGIPKSGLI